MGGIPNIRAFRMAANMPVGNYNGPNQAPQPRIQLIDGGAEGNLRLRQQLFNSIREAYRVPQEFLDGVKVRLGLAGDISVARKPLEERDVREILTDMENLHGIRMCETQSVVLSMTTEIVDKAFHDGITVLADDVFAQLAEVLPSDQLKQGREMMLPIYKEMMQQHINDAKEAVLKHWKSLPANQHTAQNMAALTENLREYGLRAQSLLKQAATKNDFDFDAEFTRRVCSMVWIFATLATHVGLLANIVKVQTAARCALKTAAALETRLSVEEAKERVREMAADLQDHLREIEKLFREIARMLDRADAEHDKVEEEASTSTIAASLDARCKCLAESVAGFERRLEELLLKANDEAPKSSIDFNAKGI